MGFLPTDDQNKTSVVMELQPGTSLSQTRDVALNLAKKIQSLPEVTQIFTLVGSATSGSGPDAKESDEVRSATLTINLIPKEHRESVTEFEQKLREMLANTPGARIGVGSGGDGELLTLTLAGEDSEALGIAAKSLIKEIRTIKGLGAIKSKAALQQPEVQIVPNLDKVAEFGASVEGIGNAVRLATTGDYSSKLNKLNLGSRQIPIRITTDNVEKNNITGIKQLQIPTLYGAIPLSSLASVKLGSSVTEIDRLDRERNITITVELNGYSLSEISDQVHQLPTMKQLPKGVFEVVDGDSEMMADLFESFAIAMIIGIFCIYCVLVLLFHDFLQPFTILSALPLSLGGAIIGLFVTHTDFTMSVIIGILMLMGVVTKNSILLVEYAIAEKRNNGISRFNALVNACEKRARPIIMTTLAMTFGMLPNALGWGNDTSFSQPMAIVVIAGLLMSTLLSLVVVPVIYTLVDDMKSTILKMLRKVSMHKIYA